MASHLSYNHKVWAKDKRKHGIEFHDLTTNPHTVIKNTGPMSDEDIKLQLNKL